MLCLTLTLSLPLILSCLTFTLTLPLIQPYLTLTDRLRGLFVSEVCRALGDAVRDAASEINQHNRPSAGE